MREPTLDEAIALAARAYRVVRWRVTASGGTLLLGHGPTSHAAVLAADAARERQEGT